MMWYFGSHMSGWAWAYMGIGTLLFWGVVIAGVVMLVRYLGNDKQSRSEQELTPTEILARRFARGEITEEEFLARTKLIKHS